MDISRRRDGRPMIRSGVDSDSKKRDVPMREKAEPKRKEELRYILPTDYSNHWEECQVA